MQPDTAVTEIEERLERIDAPNTNKNNENDTLHIKNIDTDCHDVTYDSVRVSERWRDPESGRVLTQFKDIAYTFEHSDGFQVRWSGRAFNIPPGETRKMPRFLGEHFALHLANHILDKEGEKIGRTLRADPIWRPKVLKEIIVDEEPFFSGLGDSVGNALASQVDQMNQDQPPEAAQAMQYNNSGDKGKTLREAEVKPQGNIDTTTGKIDLKSIEPTADIIARVGKDSAGDDMNVPDGFTQYSKAELIQQIRNMAPDYKFGSNYTKAQLVGVLKSIAT